MTTSVRRIAIVGAGIAGAACAARLRATGHDVTVFEKSRGAGGRMSTRRTETHAFDHGAQYATTRSEAFRTAMAGWVAAGVAAPWEGRLVDLRGGTATPREGKHPRYVGTPGMNAICKHLLRDTALVRATRIAGIAADDEGAWTLTDTGGACHGPFDVAIVTAPPVQAVPLLAASPTLAAEAARAELAPCWTWMAAFDAPTGIAFDGAFVEDSPVSWMARNSAKPERDGEGETWIVQASPAWSEAQVEQDPAYVAATLEDAFRRDTGYDGPSPNGMIHRWLFAYPVRNLDTPFLWDADRQIGACGDWVRGARIEAAWQSGHALAGEIGATAARQVS